MTRSEIRTLVLSWLDDTNGGYFTSSQVNTWINLAQREVQLKLLEAGENFYMKPVETTTVSGQADYVFPSDFITLHRLELVISGTGVNENRQPLSPITTNQQDLVAITSGIPSNYYIKKDRVTISPTPNAAYTMRLYYSPKVVDLTSDTDTPDVPEQYMEYVALIAAFNGYIKDDRMAQNLMAKKEKFEKAIERIAEERTQDIARQVVMLNDYEPGYFF